MLKKDVLNWCESSSLTLTALAQKLKISQPAVSRWADVVPELQSIKLAGISGGVLTHDQDFYDSKKSPCLK
tara:strand:- start:223 stop:435 length:213 start_codon:yes stop_codon:yes gene_type:complete